MLKTREHNKEYYHEISNDKKITKERLKEISHILKVHDITSGITPEKLSSILTDLGPTFIKCGQILSMRTDLLPEDYCAALSNLRSDVKHLDFDVIKKVVETEFANTIENIFDYFDKIPIGAASIAQVHKAGINKEDVVVKVQRPGIYETMSQDIILIKKAIAFIKETHILSKDVDLEIIVDEVWDIAKQEMDFKIEANHIQLFQNNMVDIKYIKIPKLYKNYVTSKAFVMEFIDGIGINDNKKLIEYGYNLEEIADKMTHNYVKQVLEDGFFHADPHSGNIKILGGKIVWLDLGMMGTLTESDKTLLTELVLAINNNDINRLSDAVLAIGTPQIDDLDLTALNNDLESILFKYANQSLSSINLAAFDKDFTTIIKKYKIPMRKGLSMLGRGILTIQSVILSLSNEISFVGILNDYVTNDLTKKIDLKNEFEKFFKTNFLSFKKLLELPIQLSNIFKLFDRGMSKMKLELDLSDKMVFHLNIFLNKLIKSIVMASILIGSSLICTTQMKPKILNIPALGFFGFIFAFIIGINIIFMNKKNN